MNFKLEPIKPKKPIFDVPKFEAEIKAATRQTVDDIKADYQKTVKTWRHKPTFYTTRRGTVWYIGTNDKIYGYVELGTKPHIIAPKRAGGRLHFNRFGFKAKSRVNYIDSYAGQTATKGETFAKVVHHPGTSARNFGKPIAKKREKQFAQLCRAAIRASKA